MRIFDELQLSPFVQPLMPIIRCCAQEAAEQSGEAAEALAAVESVEA